MGWGRRRAEDVEAMSWDFDWESSVYESARMVWVSDLYWDFDWKSQPLLTLRREDIGERERREGETKK
jgi:hypothetical protein